MAYFHFGPDQVRRGIQKAFLSERDRVTKEEIRKAQEAVADQMIAFAARLAFGTQTIYDSVTDSSKVSVSFCITPELTPNGEAETK
jgi:hypothetical protein